MSPSPVPRRDVVDGRFLSYLMNSPACLSLVASLTTGTTRMRIRRSDLEKLLVPAPPLAEQRRISRILGSLDDKIELNARLSETLEATARRLFRSWFVDFDPVRAKSEGRDPGNPCRLTDLFPASFEGSHLGQVPTGWRVAPIGEWADALSGGTPSKDDLSLWSGTIPWISPKVMTAIHCDQAEQFVAERAVGNGTRLAPAGATLVMVRGMGLHEKVRVSQARHAVTFNQDVKALAPRRIAPSLLLFALLDAQAALLTKVESSGHGTGTLPSDVLLDYQITMPDEPLQRELAARFDASNDRIALAREETRTLSSLRDTLLPKLISGELRVPDAERMVEARL